MAGDSNLFAPYGIHIYSALDWLRNTTFSRKAADFISGEHIFSQIRKIIGPVRTTSGQNCKNEEKGGCGKTAKDAAH